MGRIKPVRRWLQALGLASLAGGCAPNHGPMQAELDALTEKVAALNAEQLALRTRLEAIEKPSSPTTVVEQQQRPVLRVVTLTPGSDGDPLPVVDTAVAPDVHAEALRLFKEQQWEAANVALARFVVSQPDDPRVKEATLLRGECYLSMGEPARAAEQFEAVLRLKPGAKLVERAKRGLKQAVAERKGGERPTTSSDEPQNRKPRAENDQGTRS